jgi:hypothetical protein
MKKSLSMIASALALSTICAHEALAQTRQDTSQLVPKMLVRPQLGEIVAPAPQPGEKIIAYEMTWQARTPEAAARRLAGALDLFLDERVAGRLSEHNALRQIVEGDKAGSWVRIGNTPVLAKYQREYDEVRLIHEERDIIVDPDGDIGEDGVRELAETYLKRLGQKGAIDPRLYAEAAMQLGYKTVGEGSMKEKVRPARIVEYRITLRPRLNGIEMVNAGLRLGILASGELASLRLGGVTPAGEWQDGRLKTSVKEGVHEVRVSIKELMDRFYNKVLKDGETQVAWSRIMYVMPEGKSEAVIEPMLLISYSQQSKIDGQLVTSRRKTLAYSLTERDGDPVDLDAPVSKHERGAITRKR